MFGVSLLWFGVLFHFKKRTESHSDDFCKISHLKFHFRVMLNTEDENWAQTPLNAGSI